MGDNDRGWNEAIYFTTDPGPLHGCECGSIAHYEGRIECPRHPRTSAVATCPGCGYTRGYDLDAYYCRVCRSVNELERER